MRKKRKVIFILEKNETAIDLLLIKKHWHLIQNVKANPEEHQHATVVEGIDKKRKRKALRKTG